MNDIEEKNIYHNTKLLLKMYPKVIWRISNEISSISEESMEYGVFSLKDYIDIFYEEFTKTRIEERINDLTYSNAILTVLDRSMELLKKYPQNGEIYYRLLKWSYLSTEKRCESQIIELLAVSRSTYFRMKKDAINLLGTILWGYEV